MRTRQSVLAVLAAALVVGGTVLPVLADEPPPPIVGEPLTGRAAFIDDIEIKIKIKVSESETIVINANDPSRTAVVRYTVQPGAQFPWHTHAGPVVVNVASGALTASMPRIADSGPTAPERPSSMPGTVTSTPRSTPRDHRPC